MPPEVPEHLDHDYLKRRDTFVSKVLDDIFDGVYIVDRTRRILFWSKGAESITGYSREEVAGRRCSDNILNHVDENGVLQCNRSCPLVRSIKSGKPASCTLYPLHKSGHRLPVETHVSPIRNAEGAIIGAIEVFRDITKHVELRLLQERFERLARQYLSEATLDSISRVIRREESEKPVRRDVTVLFADVCGFTTFSEHEPAASVIHLLNTFFAICEQRIKECHGDIDKFIGDAVLAVFVDANDAVIAAQRILQTLRTANDAAAAGHALPIHIRIGINSGTAIQCNLGGADRKDLTVIGDVVNTSARLQTICEPDAICISESTRARLRNPAGFEPQGEVHLKGKNAQVAAYSMPASHIPIDTGATG